MTKQELIDNGYKYIATQNDKNESEIWAKLTGYEDYIQYIFYIPEINSSQPMKVTSYNQLNLFTLMKDKMKDDFMKLNEQNLNETQIWYDKYKE